MSQRIMTKPPIGPKDRSEKPHKPRKGLPNRSKNFFLQQMKTNNSSKKH